MNTKNIRPMEALLVAAMILGAALSNSTATAQAATDENALIAVLQSNAGWAEKQAACRSLRQVGTTASIGALAALLPDKELSHLARFALETMPYPEAGQALRDALSQTEGLCRIGVVSSLGVRKDPDAVALIAPLLQDPNLDMVRAALGALGRIATNPAVDAIMAFSKQAVDPVRAALAEGLLAAAETMSKDGRTDQAVAIFQELMTESWPPHIRMGAFRGRAYARSNETPDILIQALSGQDDSFRNMAAQIVAETPNTDTTKRYCDALPALPPAGQAALLRGLADRKDLAARPAVTEALFNKDKTVKLAAIKALGMLGGAADVGALAGLLDSSDKDEAMAAQGSLTIMTDKEVNPALAAALSAAPANIRIQLLALLAERRAEQAIPSALANLQDVDLSIRIAALEVLEKLGAKDQAPVLLQILTNAADASECAAAEKALTAISLRQTADMLPILLEASKTEHIAARMALLRALAGIGGQEPLTIIVAAIADPQSEISNEAVRLLADWPTQPAAPHLLTLAQGNDPTRKLIGLRGYIRLANIHPSIEERIAMLKQATALATRPEEKMPVLSGWGLLPAAVALDTLLPFLDDAPVQNEAAVAMIGAADLWVKADPNAKPRAIEALKTVTEKCQDADIRARAAQALTSLQ